jgi:hypothetical protein
VRGIQLIDRALLSDRVIEQRSHRSIADQDSLLQPLVKVFYTHRALCPDSIQNEVRKSLNYIISLYSGSDWHARRVSTSATRVRRTVENDIRSKDIFGVAAGGKSHVAVC